VTVMASDFSSSSSLVRELGALDERFAAANRTELLEAEEYPHGVMSAFAQHLCRIYEQANGDSIGVLNDTLSVLEKWLGPGDPVIQITDPWTPGANRLPSRFAPVRKVISLYCVSSRLRPCAVTGEMRTSSVGYKGRTK
jgi:hypothetical protein